MYYSEYLFLIHLLAVTPPSKISLCLLIVYNERAEKCKEMNYGFQRIVRLHVLHSPMLFSGTERSIYYYTDFHESHHTIKVWGILKNTCYLSVFQ
jgi:hypothetical protein